MSNNVTYSTGYKRLLCLQILIHMEDRLQEMFFKSRMLSEYVRNTKNVDMDELNAMFGMAITDIKFLLSVSSTHSTVNVKGLY